MEWAKERIIIKAMTRFSQQEFCFVEREKERELCVVLNQKYLCGQVCVVLQAFVKFVRFKFTSKKKEKTELEFRQKLSKKERERKYQKSSQREEKNNRKICKKKYKKNMFA